MIHRRVFEPFGKVIAQTASPPQATDQLYTGQRYQEATNLYDFRARWYDPETARFLSVDPIIQHPTDPQTHNAYGYVRNNPLNNVDPDGLGLFSSIKKFFKKGIDKIKKVIKKGVERIKKAIKAIAIAVAVVVAVVVIVVLAPEALPALGSFGAGLLKFTGSLLGITITEGVVTLSLSPTLYYAGLASGGNQLWNQYGTSSSSRYASTAEPKEASGFTALRLALRLAGRYARPLWNATKGLFKRGGRSGKADDAAKAGTRAADTALTQAERQVLRDTFGRGPEGARRVLGQIEEGALQLPRGLTRSALEKYRKVAQEAIDQGIDKIGTQRLRRDIIDRILRDYGSQLPH